MRKILIIAYFFPPLGGGGVQRVAKFTKYLPQFGFEPHVLTVKQGFYPLKDQTLLADLPQNLKISRVSYFEPGFWFSWRWWRSFLAYFLYPKIFFPDNQVLWFLPALIRAYRIIKKEKIKLVFTSSASYSDHLIALTLKKLTGIKWVADFRDQWPFQGWQQNINRLLAKAILVKADNITTISDGLTSIYQKTLGKDKDKFITITNGFDDQDFAKIPRLSQQSRKKLRIVHVGSLYGSRQTETFLQVLKALNLKEIEVEFIGQEKRVSHRQAIKAMFEADVLLLVLSPQDGPAVLTGKIFEYLAVRRPILALAPKQSGAAQLIQKLKVGEIAEPENHQAIKAKILQYYRLWQAKKLAVPHIDISPFEHSRLTARLSQIFEELLWPKRKPKLCLIGNLQAPQNQDLVIFLIQKNWEVHFITTAPARIPKAKVYYLGPKSFTFWYFLKSLLKIKKIINQIKPDLVHGQDLVFAGIWGYLSGFHPLVVTTWGSDVFGWEKFIRPEQYLVSKTLQAADLVTGPSLALKNQAQKIGLWGDKFQLVHFGIDLDIFRKLAAKELRGKLQLQGKRVIFCPRSIAPIYNTDILIEAFRVLNHSQKYKLILLEHNANQDYLLKIEKLIIKYGLVDEIIFLPKLDSTSMAAYYNLAEVVVSLASSDGCPRSFLEALGCEKKIVITKLPFTREWIRNHNFWTVPVRDVKKTAMTIEGALKYSNQRFGKIGPINRQLVAERAEINANFEKLAKLYRELL